MTTVLGLDIGGANLKAANLNGEVRTLPFPMWKQHLQLTEQLQVLSWEQHPDLVGVTMTAELADCFDCKADGVNWVIDSVRQAFPQSEVRIWLTTGEFAEPEDAVELTPLVAAANWHALATWAARAVPSGPAILMDAGSTTTDIIPLLDGLPMSSGLTDVERLQYGELVYTGVSRTPLCAVLDAVVLGDTRIPVAAEVFATTRDVHLLLDAVPEQPDNCDTADGKPLTVRHSRGRIARMLCCDAEELGDAAILEVAHQFAETQRDSLRRALSQVVSNQQEQLTAMGRANSDNEPQMILSGSGAFLGSQAAADCNLSLLTDLNESASPAVAEAACAYAVAQLVFERCRDDLLETTSFV
jgi:probable H4MPT-linked C1 transfer pathway protein